MTHNANLKRQVRARMAVTGEKYTTALAAITRIRNLEHGSKIEVTRSEEKKS